MKGWPINYWMLSLNIWLSTCWVQCWYQFCCQWMAAHVNTLVIARRWNELRPHVTSHFTMCSWNNIQQQEPPVACWMERWRGHGSLSRKGHQGHLLWVCPRVLISDHALSLICFRDCLSPAHQLRTGWHSLHGKWSWNIAFTGLHGVCR